DVRASLDEPHRLQMRHDLGEEPGENLWLAEWLSLGRDSGRGLKLDVKEEQRTPQVLDEVEHSGVPPERLMFNLTCEGIERYGPEIRRRFPGAYLAVNPPSGGPTPENLARMARAARDLGGPVTFVLREDLVTDQAIRMLQEHGSLSVWNSPGLWVPGSLESREQRLRERGVDGMIDLRPSQVP
ncbi:MAG: hypothetical protein AB1758_33535, partial [Candidatus Eremiobacterota bacterium]